MNNPYLSARRKWNYHVGGLMHSLKVWQTVGIASLLIAAGAVGGLVHVASQSKFIPLVFQQDAEGNTLSVTRADHLAAAHIADYRTAVASFISHIRLVTPDVELQKQAILQSFAYLANNAPATQKANNYLNANSPFDRATKVTVNVQIQSVLQQSAHTWQVEWLESVRNHAGSLQQPPYLMRALVNVYQLSPTTQTTESQELLNPHLIFIKDFNWSRA